jgi:hypothetical protein
MKTPEKPQDEYTKGSASESNEDNTDTGFAKTEKAAVALKLKYDEELNALRAKHHVTTKKKKVPGDASANTAELKRPPIKSDLP